jgi:hypothetical protein
MRSRLAEGGALAMRLSRVLCRASRRGFFVAIEAKSGAHYHHQTEESTSANRGAGTRRFGSRCRRTACPPRTKAAFEERPRLAGSFFVVNQPCTAPGRERGTSRKLTDDSQNSAKTDRLAGAAADTLRLRSRSFRRLCVRFGQTHDPVSTDTVAGTFSSGQVTGHNSN